MKNLFFSQRGLLAPIAAWLIIAGSANGQVVRVFEPGMEGEVWERVHRVGTPLSLECLTEAQRENLDSPSCPAGLDQLYFPLQVALWESGTDYRYFVTDMGNHRVLAFDRNAAPVALPTPIGSGIAGSGPQELTYPEGIAVDGSGLVIVADGGNDRLQVFNQDGLQQFAVSVPGLYYPTGLALRRGVSLIDPASSATPPAGAAVAVLSAGSSELFVLDAKFQILAVLGGYGDQPGEFAYATGLAFDAEGRLAVADLDNSRVQVFDSQYTPVPELVFGGSGPGVENLLGPYSLTVDSRGRILVADTGNQRLAVFQPDYTATPATATFLFDLDANGGLNGYPRGIVEDSSGRILMVDTVNDEVETFQVPDLAVFDVSIDPWEQLRVGDSVTLTFSVMVPPAHPAATGVVPIVAATGPVAEISAAAAPIPRLASDEPGTPQVVAYTYMFRAEPTGVPDPIDVTFTVSAAGNPGGITVAPPKSVDTAVACDGCEEAPPTVSAELVDDDGVALAVPPSGWFNQAVNVRFTAIDEGDAGPDGPRPPGGIDSIRFQFPFGPELRNYPAVVDMEGPTAGLDPLVGSVRLTLDSPGSTVEYWAYDIYGNRSATGSTTVRIDTTAPNVMFEFPPSNAAGWWRVSPLAVTVRAFDGLSGVESPEPLLFSQEGVNDAQIVTVTDAAGNSEEADSGHIYFGGRTVLIDSVPPVVTATPATAANAEGWYNAPVTVAFSAVDATSGVAPGTLSAPSAVGTEGAAVAITGSAEDIAGNVGMGTVVVRIDRTPPVTASNPAAALSVGSSVLVTLTASDQDGLSGVAQTFYSLSGAHTSGPQPLAGPIALSLAGTTDVTFWSVDAAGNAEAPKTLRYTIDALTPAPTEACFVVDFREITYFKDSSVIMSSDAGIRARNGIAGGFSPSRWPYSTSGASSTTRSRGTLFRIYGFKASQVGTLVKNADNPAITYPVVSDPGIPGAFYVDLGGPARVLLCPSQISRHLVDTVSALGSLEGSAVLPSALRNVPGILLTHNAQALRLPSRVRTELGLLGTPVTTQLAQVDYIGVQLQGYGNARFREFVDVQVSFPNDSLTDRRRHYEFGFHTAANSGFESFAGCNYIHHSPGNDSVRLHDVWHSTRGSDASSAGACGPAEPSVNQKVRANDAVPFNAVQLLTSVNMASDTARLYYGEIRPFPSHPPTHDHDGNCGRHDDDADDDDRGRGRGWNDDDDDDHHWYGNSGKLLALLKAWKNRR